MVEGLTDPVAEVCKYWQTNACQMLSPLAVERIASYAEDGLTSELMQAVMKDACENGTMRLSYIYKIFERCVREGILTLEGWQQDRLRYNHVKTEMAVRLRRLNEYSDEGEQRQKAIAERLAEMEGSHDPKRSGRPNTPPRGIF